METPPELSVVIVAFNSPGLLARTIASVFRHTRGVSFELIVVDNVSTDPDVARVLAAEPRVRLVQAKRNQGFAAGNNLGLAQARGRFVALVNPDVELRDDALSRMVAWLDANRDVGAVGPTLITPDSAAQPYSYGSAPSPRYLARRVWSHVRGSYLHAWSGSDPLDVDWVAGTCLVLRRSALEQVGPLDERFFLYFEDVDMGLRLRQAGYRVVVLPDVAVRHHGGGSVGGDTRRFYDRSLVLLYAKWYGRTWSVGAWLALQMYRRVQRLRSGLRVIRRLHG